MLSNIINFSLHNKFVVLLFTSFIVGFGLYSLSQIPIGAVPDITNNQVQVITTSTNLATEDIEQFITYPIELEMANLPGVTEIRSISKFGLSVVTIVFDDAMGTYLPRQLIAEKIKSASEKIPQGFGTPEMGPITTGLGEIYQYILDVQPEYKDQYSVTDLRTIQDWVVRRQLSGIPGVIEVNTWGGFLKQYEVAINTQKLSAMNITAHDVFSALEKNNSIAGGGYIEKVNQAYFIRGEGLITSLKDIENTVVTNENGLPIFIKDVAAVGFGSASRFGAITANGEGEKVLGQIMMLKDANSKKVIDAVKSRVAEISKSLPKGVYINAFLDRSELIAKTTFTVSENLILGCLIVIFVVVLLLGNLRSGLVVASVIPLCLLFALSLMYIFGVDANLMSLGAIDFGIIIDGAVIIVEFIAFKITQHSVELASYPAVERQKHKDKLVLSGATTMMNSAVFGQLIILIVFIPILSLTGVEGKMFTPMALTFSFALIGAMLFCFTYVPVAASLFLKPAKTNSKNISVRLMQSIQSVYEPIIDWALKSKKVVLASASLLLIAAIFSYNSLGAEFVPTLDEGDFVIQPVLKTGTSLSNTVEITTRIEEILIKNFPEVKQVVTRIGAAEVPTDPMSMEESDVIISLKPKGEWTSASSKDELADKFKAALAVIPGMEVEFTQPIEMRFNELITGVRADIAIKIFGEDLGILAQKGNDIGALIANVDGAADISVEKIDGLPEMNVSYDRAKIARYGVTIQELNDLVSMAFAGKVAGSVFEGEKRFDLVVRLDKANRTDIANLKNLYVDVPTGIKIPLSELATITYKTGAAKISRDDTKRRIVVGVNVRGRDLQSVVEDVQALITKNIKLPAGYTITYGGQFENLESAKYRLLIAVPIALILIFILLYFAFSSVKDALLIYSAIPLAAVGGVLLLWVRAMPFSISAGVGFIALFGIAVLNGIVLIEHFKALSKTHTGSIEALVKQGTKDRLRAVLLTASAAALGFLPMAISTNAGAEVQRPLATVVIGGLVSATILTLVVLPVLYAYLHRKQTPTKTGTKPAQRALTALLLLFTLTGMAQDAPKTLGDLLPIALENNASLAASQLQVTQAEAMIKSAYDFDKTQVYYHFDENNLTLNNQPLRVFGIQQDVKFPTAYFSQRNLNREKVNLSESNYALEKKRLQKSVTLAYYEYQIAREKEALYRHIDSLYMQFASISTRRFELGETNTLAKLTATAKQKHVQLAYNAAVTELQNAYTNLIKIVQSKEAIAIAATPILKIELQESVISDSPEIAYYNTQIALSTAEKKLEKQALLPDIGLEYFRGTTATTSEQLSGYQLGLKIPLFFNATTSRIKAARIHEEITKTQASAYKINLASKLAMLKNEHLQLQQTLDYYENEGATLSDEILKTAQLSFTHGELDFFQYIQSLESAHTIALEHLEALKKYNQTVVEINYLTL